MAQLLTIFFSVFLAELGDKTQLATLLYASAGDRSPLAVFVASSSALVLSTALAVLLGHTAREWLAGVPVKLIAGCGFLALGGLMIAQHVRAA